MRWGVALLCVAACGGETGVAIEIKAPPGVVAVEVFVGDEYCYDEETQTPCHTRGVAWDARQPPPPGTTYVTIRRLDDGNDEAQHTALQVGDHFELRLESLPASNEPEVIAFVGLDANGEAMAVARLDRPQVPTSRGEKWIVNLAPADAAVPIPTGAPIDSQQPWRATVWGRDGATREDASRCVVVQEWNQHSNEWKAVFIVPDNDYDCDGHRPGDGLECDPYYYNLNADRPNAGTLCLAESLTMSSTEGPCVLGRSPCADGVSDDATCTVPDPLSQPGAICVPDGLCDGCAGVYGFDTCLTGGMLSPSSVSHVECRVFADSQTGAACGAGNPGYVTDIDLTRAGYRCPLVDVRRLTAPLLPLPDLAFELGQANMALQYSGATTGCYIPLFFKDGTAVLGSEHWMLLGLQPDVSMSVVAKLLIPVRIEFVGANCSDEVTQDALCTIVGLAEDRIQQCMPEP